MNILALDERESKDDVLIYVKCCSSVNVFTSNIDSTHQLGLNLIKKLQLRRTSLSFAKAERHVIIRDIR